jgi:hypothetical protein
MEQYGFDKKMRRDTLRQTWGFATGGIHGSRSAFWCVRGAKSDTLYLILGLDHYGFDKKRIWRRYAKLVFLHPVGSVGHVVHSGASGVQNGSALFFMLGWDQYTFHKKCTGTRYAELVFFYPVAPAGHVVHSNASGKRNNDALFFMLRWNRYGFDKKFDGTGYAELAIFIQLNL